MKKIERIGILILAVVLGAWLLFPTLKWYALTSPDDRAVASAGLTTIRERAHKEALDDVKELKALIKGVPYTESGEQRTESRESTDNSGKEENVEADKNSEQLKEEKNEIEEDLSKTHKIQIDKAKETYKKKGEKLPKVWTASSILGAYESEAEAVSSFEEYYRTKYLNLKKTSGKALKLGLDLRGGMSVLLQGDTSTLDKRLERNATNEEISEAMDQDVEILRSRIDQYGVSEADIRRQGVDQILVEVPGDVDPERVQSFIRGQGSLKFSIVDQEKTDELLKWKDEHYSELFDENGAFVQPKDVSFIPEGFTAAPYYINDEYGLEKLQDGYPCAVLDNSKEMDASYIAEVAVGKDQYSSRPVVTFRLNSEGGDLFYALTKDNVKKPLAVVMDGKIKSIATINEALRTNVQVSGFNEKEAEDLKSVLKSTSFPVELSIASEERVGASLGEDSISLALKALLIGLSLIALFLIIYYRLPGVLAVIMLLLDVFLIVGVLSALSFTLTLTSIAGLILTLGMAVDSSVIIFERIKEEMALGKDVRSSINTAFSRARWTLLDANITTMIAAVVLSFLGSAGVKGFANTLSIGIICSLFSMLFVLHLFVDIFSTDRKKPRIHIGRVHVIEGDALSEDLWANKKKVPVIKAKYIALIFSSLVFITGAVFFAVKGGFNLGLDFKSGYMATVTITKEGDNVRIDEVRSALNNNSYTVQNRGDANNGTFVIRGGANTEDERTAVSSEMLSSLKTAFGEDKVNVIAENFIGARFSSSLVKGSLLGIALSLVLMLVYIWIRFRLSYALASVLTLLHDVLLLLAFISFTRIEMSSVTIAAILTIIGYSINNTIVIFDRVRENIQLSNGKGDLKAILERSVTQSLKRTIFSSLTTIVAVLPVAIFVQSEIRYFAICLVFGMVIGLYSANFVAPNILRLFAKIKNKAFDPMQIKAKTIQNA